MAKPKTQMDSPKSVTVILPREKDCNAVVKFGSPNKDLPLTNVYLSRSIPGVNEAQQVTVTVAIG